MATAKAAVVLLRPVHRPNLWSHLPTHILSLDPTCWGRVVQCLPRDRLADRLIRSLIAYRRWIRIDMLRSMLGACSGRGARACIHDSTL